MIQYRRCILSIIMILGLLIGCEKDSANYACFERWGIMFEYPQKWKEYSPDRVRLMKDFIAEELEKTPADPKRWLVEFTMIVSSNEEAAVMVSKVMLESTMTVKNLLAERDKVYEDAKTAGDVTKVNQLEQITMANKPAVIEDVERSNGGRGCTIKVLSGKTIIEISLVVHNRNKFLLYEPRFDHIVKTLVIK